MDMNLIKKLVLLFLSGDSHSIKNLKLKNMGLF